MNITSLLKLIGLALMAAAAYLFLRAQSPETTVIVLTGLFFLFIIANAVVYIRQGRGLEREIRRMGFVEIKDTAAFDQRLRALQPDFYSRAVRVISRPHYKLAIFVMMGTSSDGDYSREYPYAAVISPRLKLPHFTIQAKGKGPAWATALTNTMNAQLEKRRHPAVDLQHPAFEKIYLLFGADAGQVSALFSEARLNRLIADSQASTIIGGDDMLIYTLWPIPSYLKPGRKLSPSEHAQTLVDEADTLLALFGQD